MTSESGRALGEILELLVMVLIVPTIVCCVLQAAVAVVGMMLPWLILLAIALVVAGFLGAGFAVRRRVPPPVGGDLAARVPAIRRPPGIPDRRRE